MGGGQNQRLRPLRVAQRELDRRRPTRREAEDGGAPDLQSIKESGERIGLQGGVGPGG
jgi:hypothetical protein